ncbi:unnamed protein product [Leptidea sinapis]|uniref:Nuclear receptor-binding factor 2 MIT domain-containing protein n=1 Tax=Leptidea sinapis TaxID=189913 RepID=A0A5E4QGB1_9NEOP|nr:unnamed protein product [Leptidea sinapis]
MEVSERIKCADLWCRQHWSLLGDPEAHQQHRRADAHLKNSKFDEAMQCHHNAAELLLDAMKTTSSTAALESITLQHSYHLKQKDLIKSKKEQYTRVKKAMENIKTLSKDPQINTQGNDYSKLQIAIYRNIDESESLLKTLSPYTLETSDFIKYDNFKNAKKKEKCQKDVIEELQILSQNLHSLVEQLVFKVEVLKDDNLSLKEHISYLEKERVKYLNASYDHMGVGPTPLFTEACANCSRIADAHGG